MPLVKKRATKAKAKVEKNRVLVAVRVRTGSKVLPEAWKKLEKMLTAWANDETARGCVLVLPPAVELTDLYVIGPTAGARKSVELVYNIEADPPRSDVQPADFAGVAVR